MTPYRKIKLSQGKYALVDSEDFAYLDQWKWYFWKAPHSYTGYALRNQTVSKNKRLQIRMHRVLCPHFISVDHINGNGLDNRKFNLRNATVFEQRCNRKKFKPKVGSSGASRSYLKGVQKNSKSSWSARIRFRHKIYYLGSFSNEESAHRAYVKKAKELHGEFAKWK